MVLFPLNRASSFPFSNPSAITLSPALTCQRQRNGTRETETSRRRVPDLSTIRLICNADSNWAIALFKLFCAFAFPLAPNRNSAGHPRPSGRKLGT
jgi:hypothetical protein